MRYVKYFIYYGQSFILEYNTIFIYNLLKNIYLYYFHKIQNEIVYNWFRDKISFFYNSLKIKSIYLTL